MATSEEDIKTLKAALQKQREGAQDVGLVEVGCSLVCACTMMELPGILNKHQQQILPILVQGILEEVRLISWPNPLQVCLVSLLFCQAVQCRRGKRQKWAS